MTETSASLGTQFVILRHQEHAKKKATTHLNEIARPKNVQLAVRRSILFTKLTYTLSRGYYKCVYKMLKAKLERDKSLFAIGQINVNEQANDDQIWLQMETNRHNKKFLQGKTPIILCTYLKENGWGMTLSRLLIENGAKLSLRDSTNGCYPIHYACALLKLDLIHLYFRNLNLNLENTRDFNLNTPLVYFMVAFCYHVKGSLKKNNPNLSRSASQLRVRFEDASSLSYAKESVIKSTPSNEDLEDPEPVTYSLFANNDPDEIDFQKNVVATLQTYLNHLTHLDLRVNTKNKFGMSLQDFYNSIIESQSLLAKHEFFVLVRRALISQMPSNSSQLTNYEYVDRLSESENIKDANYVSVQQLTIKPTKVHFLSQLTSKSTIKLANSSSSYLGKTTPNLHSRWNNNSSLRIHPAFYPFSSGSTQTFPEASSTSFRTSSLDSLVRFNLLIPLDDMKTPDKLITHSVKIDNELVFHFHDYLKRQQSDQTQKNVGLSSMDAVTNPNSTRKVGSFSGLHRLPRPQTALMAPSLSRTSSRKSTKEMINIKMGDVESDGEPETNDESLLKSSGARVTDFTWRHRLEEYYANLQVNQSSSFRKAAVRKAPDPNELVEPVPNGKNGASSASNNPLGSSSRANNGETGARRQPSRLGSSLKKNSQPT